MVESILAVLLAVFTIEVGVRTLRWMERSAAEARVRARRR
jgi:hypothetical protein